MNIHYDPLLTEAVVLQEITRRQELGDPALYREYHVVADPLYHRRPDAREAAFQKLHARFFARLGFADTLQATLREFPDIGTQASEVIVALAAGAHEEGADLAPGEANDDGRATQRVGIRLRADRFLDSTALQRYLQHELLHVADLLDPDFGYEGDTWLTVGSRSEENIIRNRYQLLWCLSIDARVESTGRQPLADRDMRRREFNAQYRKFAPAVREAIFERLWRPEPLPHRLLLEMASGSETLLRLAGDVAQMGSDRPHRAPLPGSLCPLCRFPSYQFVEDSHSPDHALLSLIQEDFPHWTVHDGLCERCLEVYTLRAGRW